MFTRMALATSEYNPLIRLIERLNSDFETTWTEDTTLTTEKLSKEGDDTEFFKKNIKEMKPLIYAGAAAVAAGSIATHEFIELTIMNVAWEVMSTIVVAKTLSDFIEGTLEIVTSNKYTAADRERKALNILACDVLGVASLVALDWRNRTTKLIVPESLIVNLCGNHFPAISSLACKLIGACGGGIASIGNWLTPEQFGFSVNEPHSAEESEKHEKTKTVTRKWQGRFQIAGKVFIGIATFSATQSLAATATVQLSILTFQNLSKWWKTKQ